MKAKAFRGCVNVKCESYKKKHYKDDLEYCPNCGKELEYVCAKCWKVMDDNSEKYCLSCKANNEQKIEKIKAAGLKIVGGVGAVGFAIWQNRDKLVKATKVVVNKVVKK